MFSPRFSITNKVLTSIAKIEAAKEIIENSPLIPAWEVRFREDALVRSAHHGTHIEGNPLREKDVKAVLDGREVPARGRDIQEILNYREVLKFIDSWVKENKEKKIIENLIVKIHFLSLNKILPPSDLGRYRNVQAVVKNSLNKEVTFVPPDPWKITSLMKEFIGWLNSVSPDNLNPVLKAGIAHYILVAIHPFVDGNGRTARALATLILYKEGYDFKKFFALEEYYDREAEGYFAILQKTSRSKPDLFERDLTEWLTYFTEGLAIEIGKVKNEVLELSKDLKIKRKMGQIALNERQVRLVEYIQDYGQISNKEWRGLIHFVSEDTILRDLKDLMNKGLIRKKGSTKAAVYLLR